jgi:hypothetical protein
MFITILGALVVAQAADTDVCLLSLGHKVAKRQAAQETRRDFAKLFREVDARRADLSGWSRSTQALRQKTLEDPSLKELLGEGGMDDFIKAQGESSDVCHAKMLEAKRSLDGLIHQVQRLATEIEAENSVIEGNTNTIKDALEKKKHAEDVKESDIALCDEKAEAAKKDTLGSMKDEIDEMKNIADPKVRSEVATDVDYSDVIQEHLEDVREHATVDLTDEERGDIVADAEAAGAFIQIQTEEHITTAVEELASTLVAVDARSCKAVMAVLLKVERAHNLTSGAPECDQARNNLQKEFTTAFTEMTELYDRKSQEIADTAEDCKLKAHEAFEEKDEAIKETVKDATDSIAKAKDTLEGLEPVLSDTKTSVDKLRAHIEEQEKTCEMDDDVSSHLTNIRDLIVDLEECPGKNDFVLEIPDWEPKAVTES